MSQEEEEKKKSQSVVDDGDGPGDVKSISGNESPQLKPEDVAEIKSETQKEAEAKAEAEE